MAGALGAIVGGCLSSLRRVLAVVNEACFPEVEREARAYFPWVLSCTLLRLNSNGLLFANHEWCLVLLRSLLRVARLTGPVPL